MFIKIIFSLMSHKGPKIVNKTKWLAISSGICQGVASLMLLPIAISLSKSVYPIWWIVGLGICLLGSAVFHYKASYLGYLAALDLMQSLNDRLGQKISRLPLGWFDKPREGELSELCTKGILDLGSIFAHFYLKIIVGSVASVVLAIGSFFFSWRLGIIMVIVGIIFGVVVMKSPKLIHKVEDERHKEEVRVNNRVLEFARCQGVLRSCARSRSDTALISALEHQDKAAKRSMLRMVFSVLINGLTIQFIVAIVICVVTVLALAGNLNPYLTVALIGISLRYTQSLNEISEFMLISRLTILQAYRAKKIILAKELPEPKISAKPVTKGSVAFDDVSFSYHDNPVLRGVSFKADPGKMTVIVGPSGSGKTTISRLIARFYDTDSGKVLVDGVDVKETTTQDLMKKLAMVFQDVYLFDDTLIENIRVGRPQATNEEIYKVAELSGVSEIVNRLPDGWNTRVGEGGTSISGGERQRVSVARALLKQAPIVLLDEATSALDPRNESRIAETINILRQHSTLIIIAHKLSTMHEADKIVVLGSEGNIEHIGTHDELIKLNSRYAHAWAERERVASWNL